VGRAIAKPTIVINLRPDLRFKCLVGAAGNHKGLPLPTLQKTLT